MSISGDFIMKFALFFILSLFFVSQQTMAITQKIKIESGIFLNFNDKKWNYQYVKALNLITPHIFESKVTKELKVIIQKETHSEPVADKKKLVSEKCLAANKFYQNSKQGFAKSIQIKNKEVCLIEMADKDQKKFQIVYPVRFSKNSYDLISFAWKGSNEDTLKEVSQLVGDNL